MSTRDDRRVALITGAAGDIGQAAVMRLVADGWDVALSDHSRAGEGLAAVAANVGARGGRWWAQACDVTDDDDVAALFDACSRDFGAPSALFNNAGYQGEFTAMPNYSIGDLRAVLEVNVIGVFSVLQHAARVMISTGRPGAVVNSASMAGVGGAPNMAAYSASKAAVIGLTKSAAKDLAPHGIRVNAISPAFIGPGKMWENQTASQAAAGSQYYGPDARTVAQQMIEMVPMRRVGSVEEVAAVVGFLLSADASYLTGQNIEITGGST